MIALLTSEEAAAILKVSVHTLESWRASRIGPVYTKMGGLVRYRNGDLEEYVESRIRRTDSATQITGRKLALPVLARRPRVQWEHRWPPQNATGTPRCEPKRRPGN